METKLYNKLMEAFSNHQMFSEIYAGMGTDEFLQRSFVDKVVSLVEDYIKFKRSDEPKQSVNMIEVSQSVYDILRLENKLRLDTMYIIKDEDYKND